MTVSSPFAPGPTEKRRHFIKQPNQSDCLLLVRFQQMHQLNAAINTPYCFVHRESRKYIPIEPSTEIRKFANRELSPEEV